MSLLVNSKTIALNRNRNELATDIELAMKDIAKITGAKLDNDLLETSVLLESGLDSLGFAMLVASLEERLGYDPFVISEHAVYPITYGEFVDFYFNNHPEQWILHPPFQILTEMVFVFVLTTK